MATFTSNGTPITQPSPQYDLPIVCNNGVLKVSKNLFDKNDVNLQNRNRSLALTKEGYWYYVEGSTSLACRCLPNTQYTISGANSETTIFRVATIDINTLPSEQDTNDIPYSYIYRATQNEVHTFVTPSTAKWIIVQVSAVFFDSTLNTIQIEQGSTATPYRPYGQIYTDGTTETVTVTGKNLFDKNDSGLGDGYISASTGEIAGIARGHTGYFRVNPNTTYHVTLDEYQQGSANGIAFYDNDKNFVVGLTSNISYGNPPHNFTVPNNNSIVYARLTLTNNIASTNLDVIQIEQGSTATTYEPYYSGGTATAEMLLKVGDYKDVQEVLSGNVTRNVGIKVLDGSVSPNRTAHTATYYRYIFDNLLNGSPLADANSLSSHFTMVSQFPRFSIAYGTEVGLWFDTSTELTDVNKLVNWLKDQYNAGTPVIIVYPLAEPTTETVTPQPLSIQAGTNIITAEGSIDNLPLEVSYKAGVTVTITEVQNAQLSNSVEVTING